MNPQGAWDNLSNVFIKWPLNQKRLMLYIFEVHQAKKSKEILVFVVSLLLKKT